MTPDGQPQRAVDASMGLLNDVTSKALDPGYAEAAARSAVERTTADRVGRATLHMVLAVVLGVVTVVAVSELRVPAQADGSPRALLEREITERSSDADALAASIDTLSAEIAQIQADAIASLNPSLFAQLDEYEVASGTRAVTGPGLSIVLDDGENADPADDDARVQDIDLQIVTNGLWAAGAEAVAINGQRLTSLSAIRGAGPAILVDLAPLLAPYRVEAIGDVRKMQTSFARSPAANHLAFLSGTYGIVVTTTASDELELPGSSSGTLRHATLLEDVASSAPPEESDRTQQKGSP
jgi:uncharacterized protein YlxW (UPF0749 family)